MGIEIPDELQWVAKYILGAGDWPDGDETAMRRVADGWTAVATTLDTVDDAAALALNAALTAISEGETHTAIATFRDKLLSGDQATMTAVRKWCETQATLLEDGANDIEHTKLVIIGTMIVTAVELSVALATSWTGVGAVAGVAARVAGQIAVRMAIKQLIARMLTRGAAKAAARLALRGAAFEALEEGGVDLAARLIQVSNGDRTADKFGWTDLGLATFGGAVGGAVGGVLGGGTGALADTAGSTVGKLAGKVVGGTVTELGADISAQAAAAGVGAAFLGQEFKLDIGVDTFTSAGAGGVQTALESGGSSPGQAPTVPDLGTDLPGATTPAAATAPASTGDPAASAPGNGSPTTSVPGGDNAPASTAPAATGDPATSAPAATGDPSQTAPAATGDPGISAPAATGDPSQTAPAATDDPATSAPTAIEDSASSNSTDAPPPASTEPPVTSGAPVSTEVGDPPTSAPTTDDPGAAGNPPPTDTPPTVEALQSNPAADTPPTAETAQSTDAPTLDNGAPADNDTSVPSATTPDTPVQPAPIATDTSTLDLPLQQSPTAVAPESETSPPPPAQQNPATPAPSTVSESTPQQAPTATVPAAAPTAVGGTPSPIVDRHSSPASTETAAATTTSAPAATTNAVSQAGTSTPSTLSSVGPTPGSSPSQVPPAPIGATPSPSQPSSRTSVAPGVDTSRPDSPRRSTTEAAAPSAPAAPTTAQPLGSSPIPNGSVNSNPAFGPTQTPGVSPGPQDMGHSVQSQARTLRESLRGQPSQDGRTVPVDANRSPFLQRPPAYSIRRFHLGGNQWVAVATIRAHIPHADQMSPSELRQAVEGIQAIVDATFNNGSRLLSGDQFLVDVEIASDPAAADMTVSPEQSAYSVANTLRDHMGLFPAPAGQQLSPDDLREVSNDIARANTPARFSDPANSRVVDHRHLTDIEDPVHQNRVEDSLRAGNGFVRGADPRTHPYGRLTNDGGRTVPGRGNNCLDCSLAALSSFFGLPRVSAPRWPDRLPNGELDNVSGEWNGPQRVEAWLGAGLASFSGMPIPDQYQALHNYIAALGPGSAAFVGTMWHARDANGNKRYLPDGSPVFNGGHATVIVFPPGAAGPVWWDPQSGETFDGPPPSLVHNSAELRCIPIDANGGPPHGGTDNQPGTGQTFAGAGVRPGPAVQHPGGETRLGLPADVVHGGTSPAGNGLGQLRDQQTYGGDHRAFEHGDAGDRGGIRPNDGSGTAAPGLPGVSETAPNPVDSDLGGPELDPVPGPPDVPGFAGGPGHHPGGRDHQESDPPPTNGSSISSRDIVGVRAESQLGNLADGGDLRGITPAGNSPTPQPPSSQEVNGANQSRVARENLRQQRPDGGVRSVADSGGNRRFTVARFIRAFGEPVSVLRLGLHLSGQDRLDPALVQALVERAQFAVDLRFNQGARLPSGDWMMVDLVPISDPGTADMRIDLDPANPRSTSTAADLDSLTALLRDQLGLGPAQASGLSHNDLQRIGSRIDQGAPTAPTDLQPNSPAGPADIRSHIPARLPDHRAPASIPPPPPGPAPTSPSAGTNFQPNPVGADRGLQTPQWHQTWADPSFADQRSAQREPGPIRRLVRKLFGVQPRQSTFAPPPAAPPVRARAPIAPPPPVTNSHQQASAREDFSDLPFSAGPPYATQEMNSTYRGEHEVGNSVWEHPLRVAYLNEFERQRLRLYVREGRIYDADGRLFDTRSGTTAWGGAGRAIFVMDEHGNLYASNYHERGLFHHSSFLAGANIAAAGELAVVDGELQMVTDSSGHYRPSRGHTMQAINQLRNLGIPLTPGQVRFEAPPQ
ncbi:toxin glutamine deamidase domain-containing protein [Nocardia caishijiensis]|nr:toxin glutamine deamidase domain-containing protein [Nocardia caishijiensis]